MEKRLLRSIFFIALSLLFIACRGLEPGMSVLKGNYSYQVGEFQQATVNYLKGLQSERYSEWIYYNMGNVYFSLGESGAALDVWSNVEISDDLDLRYRLNFNKGVLYFQLGQYNDAYDKFKASLIANPSSIDAKINLEITLAKLSAPSTEFSTSGNRGQHSTNPAETERMLQYIKRKEGELWISPEEDTETVQQDW